MRAISKGGVGCHHDILNFVATGPLYITWVPVNPSDILTHFRLDGLQQEVVNGE